LRNEALQAGIPVQRLQQGIAFERLLARLPPDGTWVLKGGFALQLRYGFQNRLPAPPASWAQPFTTLAGQVVSMPTTDLQAGHALAAQLWDPFLAKQAVHQVWLPDRQEWSTSSTSPSET
jgi:hypothetical protein